MARYNQTSVSMPSVGNVNPVNTQQTKQLDLLSNDINNLLGGAQKANAAVFEASDYATQLAAVDNASMTQQGFQQIYDNTVGAKLANGEQPTSDDYQNMITWRTNFMKDRLTSVLGDNDNQNDIYKEQFYRPTKALLDKLNAQDTATYQKLFKNEQTDIVNKTIADSKYGMSPEDINILADYLTKLGVDGAQAKVFNTAATNAINEFAITDYGHVRDMILSGKKAELLNESPLGRYIEYDNKGNLIAKNGVEDKASLSMKKAFNATIGQVKAKQSTAKETVTKTASSLNINTPINMVENAIKDSIIQLNTFRHGDKNSKIQFEKGMQSLQSMFKLKEKIYKLQDDYSQYVENPNLEIKDSEFTYHIYNKDGIPQTPKIEKLTKEDQAKFFAETAYSKFNDALKVGDTKGAEDAITVLASLGSHNYKSSRITDVMNIFSSSDRMLQKTNNTTSFTQLDTLLKSAVAYNAAVHAEGSYLTKKVVDEVETFYNDGMAMVKDGKKDANGNTLTEEQIFQETKMLYNMKVSRPKELMENSILKIATILGIDKTKALSSDGLDVLMPNFGWDIGTTKFPSGTIESAMSYALAQGAGTQEEVIDKMREKLVKVDRTHLPIWGEALAMYNPTILKEEVFTNNLVDNIKLALGEMKELEHVDLSKLNSDSLSIRQQPIYNSELGEKQVLTMIDVTSSTGGKHTVILTPEELTNGVSDSDKLKYKDVFKEFAEAVMQKTRTKKTMNSIINRRTHSNRQVK